MKVKLEAGLLEKFLKRHGYAVLTIDNDRLSYLFSFNIARGENVFYGVASKFILQFQNESVLKTLSKKWQDFLCKNVEGYPEELVEFYKRKMADIDFHFKNEQSMSYSIEKQKKHEKEMENYKHTIAQIENKYLTKNINTNV